MLSCLICRKIQCQIAGNLDIVIQVRTKQHTLYFLLDDIFRILFYRKLRTRIACALCLRLTGIQEITEGIDDRYIIRAAVTERSCDHMRDRRCFITAQFPI